MNGLQIVVAGADGVALVVRACGHLVACVVATAVATGGSGRRLRPVRVVGGGAGLAVVVPAVAFAARWLGFLDPVVAVTGNALGTYAAAAGVLGVGAVVVASAAADAELTDPGYPSATAAFRAHLSGDDLIGVVVGTVALVSGELATLAVANAL